MIFWPAGNGFVLGTVPVKAVFVGGGIGVPPLWEASKEFGSRATAVLGFRNREAVILEEDFRANGCGYVLRPMMAVQGTMGLLQTVSTISL